MYFRNRIEAGQKLAELFKNFKAVDTVVYALPRGGVVIGAEIAKAIHSPLDLIITRKIGHPLQPEYAIGAVSENGHSILNKEEVLNVDEKYIKEEAEKQKQEAKRRREVYLDGRKPIPCRGKIAILVDDGIATGLTMKAATLELKLHYHPSRIIVAVPIIPREIADELELQEKVELIALEIPDQFLGSIGAYYQNFSAVEDADVVRIMKDENIVGNNLKNPSG